MRARTARAVKNKGEALYAPHVRFHALKVSGVGVYGGGLRVGRSGALAVGRASEEKRDNQEERDTQTRRAKTKRRDKPRRKDGDDSGNDWGGGGKTDGGCKISASLKIKVTSARAARAQ